jgi:hypothetical protein
MPSPSKIDELDVVDILLRSSDAFREFYVKERCRAGHIDWTFDPELSEKIKAAKAATMTRPNSNQHEICLSEFPVQQDDARLIAHEMMHAIFEEEKNTVIIYGCNTQLKAHLASMVEDPLVEAYLYEKYNFDQAKDYLRNLEISKRKWMFVDEPVDTLYRIANAFIFTNQAIRWKMIKDRNALRIWNSYLDWLSNYCSHIFSIHLDLIAIVEKSGLDMLEQRKAIVLEIIEKYQLGAFISLENKFCT